MDGAKHFLYIVFFGILRATSASLDQEYITIGVIADVTSPSPWPTSFLFYNYNVTYVWVSVKTDEIYHVYNAVQQLDEDPTIDVIIHADVSQASQVLPHLLQTHGTPLIPWGVKALTTTPEIYDDACEGADNTVFDSDIEFYCALRTESLNGSNITRCMMESFTANIPGSIAHLLVRLKWKFVIVLHDTQSDRIAYDIIDHMSKNGMMLISINIDNVKTLADVVSRLYTDFVKNGGKLHFLIACRYHCTRNIVRMANSFDDQVSTKKRKTLLKQFSLWLIVLLGYEKRMSRGIRACAHDLDNVAIVAVPDWKGSEASTITKEVDKLLLELKRMQLSEMLNATKDGIIDKLVEKATLMHPSVHCQGFNVDTLLWSSNEGRKLTNVGYVDVSGKLMVTSDVFPNIKYGYNKRKFLISTLAYSPFVMSNTSANGTKTYYGFCIDLLEELAARLNFTFTLTEPKDGKWGSFEDRETEQFNGLIGQLQNREVDMVGAPISIQVDRARQMDFTYPFYYEYTTIVMKRLDPMKRKWRTLLDPFKWQVLVAIGIALLIATPLLWLLEKWNPFYRYESNAQHYNRRHFGALQSLPNTFWYMYGALLCQGGVHLPDSVAGRTFASCWCLFCIIVVGTYSGNLIAFLTVTRMKPPFTNLRELVALKGEYNWGILGGTAWENVFLHQSRDALYREVGKGLRDFNQSDRSVLGDNPFRHIQKVLEDEQYAWIGDETFIDFSLATECNLMRTTEKFLPLSYAFGFQNNSPHAIIFSEQLMKIHEGGLLKIWKRKWWPRTNFCGHDRLVTDTKPITLPDVQSAFYVCLIGICLGLLALIGELLIYRCKSCRHSRQLSHRRETGVH